MRRRARRSFDVCTAPRRGRAARDGDRHWFRRGPGEPFRGPELELVSATLRPAFRRCAIVEITRGKLTIRSGIDEAIIHDFERKLDKPDDRTVKALQVTLEELGAVFIDDNGGGIGVRLKFTESEAKRIARMEGEGGIVANDRVP